MALAKGNKARVKNRLKNNLRPLPKIDNLNFLEIENGVEVMVLDGPEGFPYQGETIPYWAVRVLGGAYPDAVGWMAEKNQSGDTILVTV